MLKIGLTGGIGSGKSAVSELFKRYAIPIIDADFIAHQLTKIGQPALDAIQQAFGEDVFEPNGKLNRARLRDIIFADTQKKQQLEAILHPLIYAAMQEHIDQLNTAYCIVSVPLLIENKKTDFVDRVLIVDCPETLQIARVKARDKLSEAQIQAIMAHQVSRTERLAHADDVIDNSKQARQLAEQVKKLHTLYLQLSST